jgi:4-amino-4-deoxy-L-arabinose transferase-like glycosyltransferase
MTAAPVSGRARASRERRDLWPVFAVMALGFALRLIYVLCTQDHKLLGDAPEYDSEARFIAAGHWFWTTLPYGVAHAGAWKAPVYPAWTGVWYSLLGSDPDNVRIVQTFVGPVVIGLTFVLGRRLFGYRAGLAAAAVVAVYPLAWQYEALLYPETLATPLTLLLALLVLDRRRAPTVKLAVAVGVVLGVGLLLRPTSFFLVAFVGAAWWVAAGARRGLGLTVLAGVVALLVIAPWSARNHRVLGGSVPISIQDAAAYGTFNDQAAHDKKYPWAWRPVIPAVEPIVNARPPLSDVEFRRRLDKLARDYVSDHPSSVPKAFFWNGLSRLWDVRRPNRALAEVPFDGRSRTLTKIGLGMYYLLLPLALLGLWRSRRRPGLLIPIAVLALGSSLVFTVASGTRYRAPLEPLIVVLACGAVAGLRRGEGGPLGPATAGRR